jgi:hypothetical protein
MHKIRKKRLKTQYFQFKSTVARVGILSKIFLCLASIFSQDWILNVVFKEQTMFLKIAFFRFKYVQEKFLTHKQDAFFFPNLSFAQNRFHKILWIW